MESKATFKPYLQLAVWVKYIYLINTASSGDPINSTPGLNGVGQTRQQFVEMSNVQLVEEMTDLITGQRAYEANSKAIVTSDEMLQTVNGLKR